MGKASQRKKQPKPPAWAGGVLDKLYVVVSYGELGYQRYHMDLSTIPDYGWLLWTGRVMSQQGSYPHQAANDLFREALKIKGWTRLLSLEHDHSFPPDVFRRHAQAKQPIYAGVYTLRDIENPLPVFFVWDKGRNNAIRPDAAVMKKMLDEPGVYPVDCVPMGCTSIAREVLESWPKDKPFFNSGVSANGTTISHDIFFSRVAQDAGWQPTVDTSLLVDHFTLVPTGIPYFIRWWNTVGVNRAIGTQHLKDQVEVVAPADGTKRPRILCVHAKGGLRAETRAALDASGQGVVYTEAVKDEDYFTLCATFWAQGQTFITVEQDIVPARGQVAELLACPEPWCAFAYEYPPFGYYAGMGLAKFSDALIGRHTQVFQEIAQWHDAKHPPMHWCRVDGYLRRYLMENGEKPHIHGTVQHLHKGRPAHDCVRIYQEAENSDKFHIITDGSPPPPAWSEVSIELAHAAKLEAAAEALGV